MAKIPFEKVNSTKNLIENQPDEVTFPSRSYLGMSGIGGSCIRKLWLGFRWASMSRLSIRSKRIFERGDIEEKRIITDLKKIGIEVFSRIGDVKIEMTGDIGERQEELVGGFGHAKGHPDGRCLNVPEAPKTEHCLEMKTMGSKYFKSFLEKGIKESHPVYYAQVNRYMKAMGLERTLFIATNKDTEERHYERIHLDNKRAAELIQIENEIITSDVPVGEKFSPGWFECKYCNQFDVCHAGVAPLKTCRSCEYSDRALNGVWICTNRNNLRDGHDCKELSVDEQKAACKFYKRAF